MESTAARATWAAVEPRVRPQIKARAFSSQYGAPKPAKAGPTLTPPAVSTPSARPAIWAAGSANPSKRPSHSTVAPVLVILPSSANCGAAETHQATVAESPPWESGRPGVAVMSEEPVP